MKIFFYTIQTPMHVLNKNFFELKFFFQKNIWEIFVFMLTTSNIFQSLKIYFPLRFIFFWEQKTEALIIAKLIFLTN